MTTELKLASEFNFRLNQYDGIVFIDKHRLSADEMKSFALFSNTERREKYNADAATWFIKIPVLRFNPVTFRKWLWKKHNEPRLEYRDIKLIENEFERNDALAYYTIRSVAKSFSTREQSVILIENEMYRPAAEVLVRYINYVNSLSS